MYAHPGVRECSVFALPDERLGEVVGAAVWCTDAEEGEAAGGSKRAQEIAAVAAKAIAKFKVPLASDVFILGEELPKGATGKIDKKGLRARFSDVVEKRPPKSKL